MRALSSSGECVAFTVSYVPGCQIWVVFLFPSTDEVRVGGCGPQAEERCVCVSVYVCVYVPVSLCTRAAGRKVLHPTPSQAPSP